jgi:hypothetical protein
LRKKNTKEINPKKKTTPPHHHSPLKVGRRLRVAVRVGVNVELDLVRDAMLARSLHAHNLNVARIKVGVDEDFGVEGARRSR